MSSAQSSLWAMRLDDEDRALLEDCAELEKLPRSEIMRRGLRRYAQELGVAKAIGHVPPAKRSRTRGKR